MTHATTPARDFGAYIAELEALRAELAAADADTHDDYSALCRAVTEAEFEFEDLKLEALEAEFAEEFAEAFEEFDGFEFDEFDGFDY